MKQLSLFLLVVLGACSPKTVATLRIHPNRILYSSAEISQRNTADSIVRLKPGGFFGKNLKLMLRNGERKTISKKLVWGYSDENGNIWRRFRSSYYQVLQIRDVVEYEIIEPRPLGNGGATYESVRKYSKTLDSKIVGSRKRAFKTNQELKTD